MRALAFVVAMAFSSIVWSATLRGAPEIRQDSATPALSMPLSKAATPVTVQPSSYLSYYIDLPSNIASMTVSTTGATGEADLLIRQGIPHTANNLPDLISQSSHVATTVGGNELITITRSSARAITPGRWWLTIVNPGSAAVTVQLDATTTVAGNPFALSAGQSGTWYQPSKTYQGFFVELLSSTSALAIWFTFQPDGRQAYLLGVGTVSGDRITFPEMTRTRGAKFGAAFLPSEVIRENWGSLVLTYDACSTGFASYLPSQTAAQQGWPSEQLVLSRLTTISGLPCPTPFNAQGTSAKYLRTGISGAWFDPARSGEGWLVETLTDTLGLVYWFSYTPTGEQAWWGGVGDITNSSITVNAAVQPIGGRFGEGYNPAQVTLTPWGPFAMTFNGCSHAVLAAFGPPTYGPVDYNDIARITTLATTNPCGFAVAPVAVAGSVTVPSGSFADGDTNNPATPNRDNDAPAQEQALSNPAIVSGFLAATGTGRAGDRFQTETDVIDAYTLPMVQGQVIRLAISDYNPAAPTEVDFDLYLYPADNPNQPIEGSEGTGAIKQIIVPSNGSFDIVIRAASGHGNYVLSVDNSGTAMASVPGALSSLSKISPGDIIVALKTPDARPGKAARKAAELGLQFQAGAADRSMLFNIGDEAQRKIAAKSLGVRTGMLDKHSPWTISDPEHRANHELIKFVKALRSRPEIEYAEPNFMAQAMAVPNDQFYPLQWHYPMINLPQAWDITTGSRNVVVAVIDTGVVHHPDLVGNVDFSIGADFISNPLRSLDFDGLDRNAFDVGDRRFTGTPSSFHGTHVAGTVGASSNNSSGVAGVNWLTTIMPVRVLGLSGGDTWDITNGIRWAAGLPTGTTLGTAPRKADVINLSLGGLYADCPQEYASAIASARAAGAVVVASAGNGEFGIGTSTPYSPANCPGAIAVSNVDRYGQLARDSSFGQNIDVAAPGGCGGLLDLACQLQNKVLSTHASDAGGIFSESSYNYLHGTSMAAPHVAGVVALMKSVYPGMTPAQLDGLVSSGAITRDLGIVGPDPFYGYGLIDAFKAVGEARRLATAQTLPPAAQVTPTALDFGTTSTTQNIALSNIGQGTLTASSAASTQPWLSVAPQGVDAQGLGTYTITVNRNGLVAADYSGQVNFVTNAGTKSLSVAMRVGAIQQPGDVSTVYVLVIDALTGQSVYAAEINGTAGNYPWSLPSVLPGNYYILAGTDIDNDQFICDAGEACGAYFTLSDPSLLNISTPVTLSGFSVLPDSSVLSGTSSGGTSKLGNSRKP
jgi:serine protease